MPYPRKIITTDNGDSLLSECPKLQEALLRVIEEKIAETIGSEETQAILIQVIEMKIAEAFESIETAKGREF